MHLEFHRQVASDVSRIFDYYEETAGTELADQFLAELWSCFQRAADVPEAYVVQQGYLRRVNLERFPYHFLFRVVEDRVRVLVVRHHRRRPSLGVARR